MKKNFKFIALAAAAVAMVGCAKDNGAKPENPDNGVATVASFHISLPSSTVRAIDDVATVDESKVQDAWVFIFNPTTERLLTKVELEVASDGLSASKSAVATTTGAKNIFVTVNAGDIYNDFPDSTFPVQDEDSAQPGITMANFFKLVLNTPADLPATANYFLMTGYDDTANFVAPTVSVPNPVQNNVRIGVGRGVAKVHMADAHTEDPEDVTVTDLKYKVINNPVKMRSFQKYDADAKTGTIVNEITGDGATRTNYYYYPNATLGTGYLAESNVAKAGVYVPENWNDTPTTHNATTLLIQGVVNVDVDVLDQDGDVDAGYTPGETFYRVWDKTEGEWLDLFFSEEPQMDPIRAYLLLTSGTPSAFSTKKYEQETPGVREFFVAEYKDAHAYWTLPLEKSKNSHVVARNDYFWVTVLTIANIGASSDDEDDEDGILPPDPEPLDEVDVDIEVKIDLLKWNGIEQPGNI